MQRTNMVKMTVVVGMIGVLLLGTGCQPWEQKYAVCQANLENLEALFDRCQEELSQQDASKEALNNMLAQMQSDLQSTRARLADAKTFDYGFGGEDVRIDPEKGTITVTLPTELLFASGKVTLKSSSKGRLTKIADQLNSKYSDKEIWVVGHTDTDPIKKSKWKDNWQLSTERALAVTRYLIERKVSAQQLAAVGRGEFHPVGKKKTANRRVEIVVNMY